MPTDFDPASMRIRSAAPLVLATALSLSLGWGIRGNFGHEFGAMIPGALAALAAVLLSGREDWQARAAFFAFFGAVGWSFGGSMSYMMVIGYTHSGYPDSVLYGYANLFAIGFLWAAMGGAGTALPACLDRERLTGLIGPMLAVFLAWAVQELAVEWWSQVDPAFRHDDPLYWYDTDWLAALVALAVGGVWRLVRRRPDEGASLILHLAIGWWLGFLVLVNVLGWRMTPPRGDNWSGCVGMTLGLWVWLGRRAIRGALLASLIAGFWGGCGFALAQLLKVTGILTGWQTNWHSVLEQSYGFINGLGAAVALLTLAARGPVVTDRTRVRRWTEVVAVAFVLVGITFLNLRKNPADWVKAKAMPELLYGWSPGTWFHLAYLALALAVVGLLIRHQRRPMPLLPASALGQAQWLYLVFLWWMVVGNFERAVVAFAPVRLVTEGVIFLNAVVCTVLVLGCSPTPRPVALLTTNSPPRDRRAIGFGLVGMAVTILGSWALTLAVYGRAPVPHAGKHIRFGPDATAVERPVPGRPHP